VLPALLSLSTDTYSLAPSVLHNITDQHTAIDRKLLTGGWSNSAKTTLNIRNIPKFKISRKFPPLPSMYGDQEPSPAPLKLRPYGAIQICLLLLLLLMHLGSPRASTSNKTLIRSAVFAQRNPVKDRLTNHVIKLKLQ